MLKKLPLFLLVMGLSFLTNKETIAQSFTKSHAVQHLEKNLVKLGLQATDISEIEVTDNYVDKRTGITHMYLRQNYQGVPVRQGVGSIHIKENGEVFYATNKYVANLAEKVTNTSANISKKQAIQSAASQLNLTLTEPLNLLENHEKSKEHQVMFNPVGISRYDIPVREYYEFDANGMLRLVYEAEIYLLEEDNWWLMRMDAADGKELSRDNLILHCNFGGPEHIHIQDYHHFAAVPKVGQPLTDLSEAQNEHRHSTVEQKMTTEESTTNFGGTYNHFGEYHLTGGGDNGDQPYYNAIESPIHTSDGSGSRNIISGDNIINTTASPLGWHDTGDEQFTWTQGNNVLAFHNPQGTLVADPTTGIVVNPFLVEGGIINTGGNVPDGGPNLEFEYDAEINTANYNSFLADAITNLFVCNNVMHDVTYLYGFDEAAGNFQTNNFDNGGTGGDHVLAGAQAQAFVNNASFGTQADGIPGEMKMYIWTSNAPEQVIDGDFDAGVIGHEYGHGVSIRMVGGPSNQCLGGDEQGGEGWSDFEGLMITQTDYNGDGVYSEDVEGEGIRGIGNYVLNQGSFEEGIRLAPYTTNMTDQSKPFNDYTYGDQPNVAAPHGVGFIWCSILWDLNWAMINKYGFEWDIYNNTSGAGNIRTMALVHEAFHYTPCSPTFIEMRDAIFQANEVLYPNDADGDEFMMWEVFARRGLGFSASAGGNEAFDLPSYAVSKSVNFDEQAKGNEVTYGIEIQNNFTGTLLGIDISDQLDSRLTFTSSTDGASAAGQVVTFPTFDIPVGETTTKSFKAEIDANTSHTESISTNSLESAVDRATFTTVGAWTTDPDAHTGSVAYFHPDPETANVGDLIFTTVIPAEANAIAFWQKLATELAFDGGVFDISTDGGVTYEDLGNRMLKGPYNSSISSDVSGVPISVLDGRRAFSGDEPYFQTIVDLTGYSGAVMFRWRFGSDALVGATGWWIDDIEYMNLHYILNETCVVTTDFVEPQCADVGTLGTVIRDGSFLAVDLLGFKASADQSDIRLDWQTANEENNKGFEILRRSENEDTFKSIAYVSAQENSNTTKNYQYLDREVETNVRYYYQLRIYDNSGKSELSEIASAIIKEYGTSVDVFPNPASTAVNIQIKGTELTNSIDMEVINATGQIVRKMSNLTGSHFTIDCVDLPEQLYMIRITSGEFVTTQQVLIQR